MKNFFITARGVLTLLWSWISTAIYSIICMTVLLFSRGLGYKIGVLWCRHILACGGVSAKVIGLEKIQPYKKYILVCNHQSNLDILSLMNMLPLYLVFIAKKELFLAPFFGWGIKALGHIAIDRSSPRKARESFMLASEQLKKEDQLSWVIFPEGTRSPDGKLKEFKQGSFALAIETGLPILPIAIKGTHNALPKHSLLIKPAKVEIIIGDSIDTSSYKKNEKDKIAITVRKSIAGLSGQAE